MLNTYKNEDFYLASEVAEIEGLSKVAVIERCKKGFYSGAVKADPTPGNPHGAWLIPKNTIDNPVAIHDVANLTRQINVVELEQNIGQAITTAVNQAIEPLHQEITELKQQLTTAQDELRKQALEIHKTHERAFSQFVEETRAERKKQQKAWWKFWS